MDEQKLLINLDRPAKEDLLGRKKFAKEIAKNLLYSFPNGTDSLIFGLSGKWGSGKSTLLNYIKTELDEYSESGKIILEFNPWYFSGQAELQKAFLTELAIRIGDVNANLKEHIIQIIRVIDYMSPLKYLHSGLGDVLKDAKATLENFTKDDSIKELKEKVDRLIIDHNYKLFIFIDDIDRLQPKEIAEIFRLIKLNAGFKNTIYILSFDKGVVQEALTKELKVDGNRYLEKIIQVDYTVPEILQERIEDIFFNELEKFLDGNDIAYNIKLLHEAWIFHRFKDYFRNLREVYRYINALHFRFTLIHQEVNITDYLLLEGIRIFDYDSYKKIYELYITSISKHYSPDVFNSKELDEIKNPISKTVIKYLVEKITPLAYYSNSTEKFLADPHYLDRYFAIEIKSSDVLEEDLKDFLTNRNKRDSVLKNSHKFNRISNLLRRLSNPAHSERYSITDTNIFYDFFRFWDDKESILEESDLTRIWDIAKNIAFNFSDKDAGISALYKELVAHRSGFSCTRFYALYIILLDKENGYLREFKEAHEIASAYEPKFIKSYKEMLMRNSLSFMSDFNSYRSKAIQRIVLEEYCEVFPDEYSKNAGEVYRTDEQLIAFLNLFIVRRERDNKPISFNCPVKKLFPTNHFHAFNQKLESININLLNSQQQEIIEFIKPKNPN